MEAIKATTRLTVANILFATDFSVTSDRALHVALALADWYGSKIFVTHAITPEPHYNIPLEPIPVELDPLWQIADEKMEKLHASEILHGVAHETILERGNPWPVVSRVSRQQKIDLIVAGTHGRTGLKKLVLGSQAETIFRQASCPVLTVGPHVPVSDANRWNPKTVLFTTDFSDTSVNALPLALSIAEESESNLVMLHITTLIPIDDKEKAEIAVAARLKALLPPDAELWCKPQFIMKCDFPAEGILQTAEECNADLIVMGVRSRTLPNAASHLPWATASEVVSRALCPVLTVRG
jgi:nucleotide-binding universal stress UspA family protein